MAETERNAGEQLFERYLDEHGYPPPEHEPDLGIDKNPDYLVRRPPAECVCELKEFSFENFDNPFPVNQRFGSRSMKDVLQPIRDKIRNAAKQLKPLAESGRPLAVVLANPAGVPIDLSEHVLVWAMYGDPVYSFNVDPTTGAQVGEGQFGAGRNGKLRNDHAYVSALIVVSERLKATDYFEELPIDRDRLSREEVIDAIMDARGQAPKGSYTRVDVFKTLSSEAAPVPAALFDGPNDRTFEFDAEQGAFVQTRGRLFGQRAAAEAGAASD